MRSGILRTRAATLRLRADAPWPSQLFELDNEGRRVRYIFKALRAVAGSAKNADQNADHATLNSPKK